METDPLLQHPYGVYYILGRLMVNRSVEVRRALIEDVLDAIAEGYELPRALIDWLPDGIVITDEGVLDTCITD